VDRPFGLLAELTYGCPLHCPYCSNPLDLGAHRDELTTAEWLRVLAEARELGVLQLHLSGGEPLLRRDLADIVRGAAGLGLYTNLITSALVIKFVYRPSPPAVRTMATRSRRSSGSPPERCSCSTPSSRASASTRCHSAVDSSSR